MFTLFFIIFVIAVFGKLAIFAFKAAWGIVSIIACIVFAPLLLIGLLLTGLIPIAIILLVIAGIVSLVVAR